MREGRIERALREHLAAHPDEAFSTDDLCEVCYPGVPRSAPLAGSETLGRKHRVAVLRAAGKVLAGLPDWRSRHTWGNRGNMRVVFNAASVPSTAKADVSGYRIAGYASPPSWDKPERLAEAERKVGEHLIMRHGTNEQRHQLTERREAEQQLRSAKLRYAVTVARNPVGVLLSASRIASGNISELAEKARALMVENDPDAIRAGLAQLADALDAIARETRDPMATVQERLAA